MICLVGLASADPAIADWQYTKWGMSQEQAISASKGEARRVRSGDDVQCNHGDKPFGIIERKKIGNFDFKVSFGADKTTGKLTSVRLDYQGNVFMLQRALLGQYGKPLRQDRQEMLWRDDKAGNLFLLYTIMETAAIMDYRSSQTGL